MGSRMGLVWWVVAAAMAATATAAAVTHEVGGAEGWHIPTDPSFYSTWAADKTFNVGDKLEFKWTATHNVLEVTVDEYGKCSGAGTPQRDSPVTISLDTAGSKYFICTVGTHCMSGQKLTVTVGSKNSTTAPPPKTTPPPTTTPAAPTTTPAAPTTTPAAPTTTPAAPPRSSAPASLLPTAISAAMFAIGSFLFICL